MHRWIDGECAVEGRVAEPETLARDLAAFIRALRQVDVDVDGAPTAYRGVPLATVDAQTRAAIEDLAVPMSPSMPRRPRRPGSRRWPRRRGPARRAGCTPISCPATCS